MIKSFFDITKTILTKSKNISDEPDFKRNSNIYMVLRHLSCNDNLMPYVEIAQRMTASGLSDVSVYNWLYTNIPKQNGFLTYYIKKNKSINKGKRKETPKIK